MRRKIEPVQKGNPHGLVVNQHVFPRRSIERLALEDGRVELADHERRIVRLAAPIDGSFCARRAWDQRAETGYMKSIEDEFQALASRVAAGIQLQVTATDSRTINQFFALWQGRALQRDFPDEFLQMHGVTADRGFKPDDFERLEAVGVITARADGSIPTRHINGVNIQLKIGRAQDQLAVSTRWGVVHAMEGEFLVPDIPRHAVVPITPTIAFASPTKSGTITRANLAEINTAVLMASEQYVFARKLALCPGAELLQSYSRKARR